MVRYPLALTTVLLAMPPLEACNVPVFRYALERWQPASYSLLVYHRGPLTQADRKTIDRHRTSLKAVNLTLRTVDLADTRDKDLLAIWEQEGPNAPLPGMVLRYPESGPTIPSLWAAPLTTTDMPRIVDSPCRRELFDRLTAGHAGVILLLLSGDATADEAARRMLQQEADRLASRIELPPRSDEGPQIESLLPLRISFPVVEVPRTADEQALVQLLLGSEDGLDRVSGPIAFPVFGRGRALCSLYGKDLTSNEELQLSLEFLCRACSCQVKELNPGLDLLIAGNWDRIFLAESGPPPRTMGGTGFLPVESRPATAGTFPVSELRSPPPRGYQAVEVIEEGTPRHHSPWRRMAILLAACLVLATGVWAIRARRNPPPASAG